MIDIYKNALENIDLFIIITDLNGNIIYSNNAFSVGLYDDKATDLVNV